LFVVGCQATDCFWAIVGKMVRPMLPDRCLSCLSVCNIGVLWPNGWVDQGASWYGGRPTQYTHIQRHTTHTISQAVKKFAKYL